MDEQQKDIRPEETTIDTGWKNPPTLTDLKADLQEAQSHHDSHITEVDGWLDNLNITGSARVKKETGRSSVTPKLIRKQAEWRYAALSESFLSHEDLFTCDPRTHADTDSSRQAQVLLNYQFNCQIDRTRFIDHYVRAGVDEGTALVRCGWDFEEEEVEVPNIEIRPLNPNNERDQYLYKMIELGSQAIMENGPAVTQQMPPEIVEAIDLSMQHGQPVRAVENGTKKVMKTVKNQPIVEVCDYNNLVVDPTCKGDLEKAGFIAFEFETSRGELEKDGRYENLDEVNYERNAVNNRSTTSENEEDTGSFNFKDEARKRITAYEYWGYWDIDKSGIPSPIVATWVGDTLIRMEISPFPDKKLPFVLVQYLPRRRNVYGEPDGALLDENQKIIGAVTRGMIDLMGRSANGQTGVRKDALDLTNMRKFEAGKDYYFNPQVDPRGAFFQHTYPEIPTSAPFMIQFQNNEAESLTGVKAFANQGITGEGLGRSATAARSAMDAASKRELGILRRLAQGMVAIGRKIMAMNSVFLSEEEIVRVTDEEFVTIKRDDLSGKYDIKLKISTAEADNAKAQELAFMLQTTGPNSDPGEVRIIRAEIARLRKMPELAKKIEEYQPQPDPVAMKRQELELMEIEAKIMKLRSEAAENFAEAELDLAQADKAKSEKNQVDLDFVEQESGVKQAQELQKQGEQARSQAATKVLEAGLKNESNTATE
jgi:hypothetical protein